MKCRHVLVPAILMLILEIASREFRGCYLHLFGTEVLVPAILVLMVDIASREFSIRMLLEPFWNVTEVFEARYYS